MNNPDIWAIFAVVILVVLCAGQPDLLDAITAWVNRQ